MTSNLFIFDAQSLREKLELSFTVDDIMIRMFKLDESLKFIQTILLFKNDLMTRI